MVAKRIQGVLEELLSIDHIGFISKRFVGENTRLLFDTITYCADENISLVIVDYAKVQMKRSHWL